MELPWRNVTDQRLKQSLLAILMTGKPKETVLGDLVPRDTFCSYAVWCQEVVRVLCRKIEQEGQAGCGFFFFFFGNVFDTGIQRR